MRAVLYERTGPSSVLRLEERPVRKPSANEVRVRVAVSGVNPTDWKARSGDGGAVEPAQVPNQDGAGVIDELGSAVSGFAVGDRVWLWDVAWQSSEGTAQDYAIVPARQVVSLPQRISFDVGASLGIPAITAHRALTGRSGGPAVLRRGALADTTVLVAGGAGAVGHAATQLAAWAGATVITTVSSSEKADLARSAGAHHVVNYRTQDPATEIAALAPGGVDIIVEVNPQANLILDVNVSAPNGLISVYADTAEAVSIPVRESMIKNTRWQFVLTYTSTEQEKKDAVSAISAALRDDALPVGTDHGLPVQRFDLDHVAAAHDAVEGGFTGKVLIDVHP